MVAYRRFFLLELGTPTSGKIFMVKEKELLEEWRGLASFSCSASFPKLIPV